MPNKESKDQRPYRIALIATIIIVSFAAICTANKWPSLWDMSLAHLGDFIGGFGSLLALIWLIAGYWQQSIALDMQHAEMTKSNQAQSEQAKALQEQLRRSEHASQLQLEPAPLFVGIGINDQKNGHQSLSIRMKNKGAPVASVVASSENTKCIFRPVSKTECWDEEEEATLVIGRFDQKEFPVEFSLTYYPLRGKMVTKSYRLDGRSGPMIPVDA